MTPESMGHDLTRNGQSRHDFMCDLIRRLTPHWKMDDHGCWLWTGDKTKSGYGRIAFSGKTRRVHRVVYSAFISPIPSDSFLCHRCDVRNCFNPSHLFIGTHQDNMDDMSAKGRVGTLHGESSPNAKLTASAVREMRLRYAKGEIFSALANEFKVSRAAARCAILRITWTSVE